METNQKEEQRKSAHVSRKRMWRTFPDLSSSRILIRFDNNKSLRVPESVQLHDPRDEVRLDSRKTEAMGPVSL